TLTLYYRNGDEGVYQPVAMSQRLAELVGRIPAAVTRSRTVHYYIEARAPDGKLAASSGKANAPNVIYIDPAAPAHYYRDAAADTFGEPAPPPLPPTAPPPPPVERAPLGIRVGKWVATGGGGALMAAGIGLWSAAAGDARALEGEARASRTECQTPPCRVYTDARKDLESAGKRYQTWGYVAFTAAGVALVGAGVLWYLDLRA